MQKEVNSLLEKNAVRLVPTEEAQEGFYSTMFLVPKMNSMKLRPVINLKPLNRYMRKRSFKMDHLKIVLSTLKPQFWGLSKDLSDAYFHITIRPSHWKFLRFSIAGQILEFKLCHSGPPHHQGCS